jgi:hypothetical protein
VPEPVDAPADFVISRGNQRAVTYSAKVPATDTFAAAVAAVGVRGPLRVVPESVDEGTVRATHATWVLTGLDTRPTLHSKITDDDGREWVVETVEGFDPYTCDTTLM